MSTKYKIEWLETKPTAAGAPRKIGTISDGHTTYENVTFWPKSWNNFNELSPGMEVMGDYKDDGKYRTLFQGITNSPSFVRKPAANIAAAMDKKAANVATAQENKSEGIKISSTIRMAVDISLEESRQSSLSEGEIKERVKFWRAWLWNEWSKDDKDYPPFN